MNKESPIKAQASSYGFKDSSESAIFSVLTIFFFLQLGKEKASKNPMKFNGSIRHPSSFKELHYLLHWFLAMIISQADKM